MSLRWTSARGGQLLLGVQLLQGRLRDLTVDALAAQLLAERPGGQASPPVPASHPQGGEQRIVDHPDLGESAQHLLGGIVRYALLGQRGRQLGASPRPALKQAQTARPSKAHRVGLHVSGSCRS